jgi:16S rRNA (guanine527-N7)-methyltransferase
MTAGWSVGSEKWKEHIRAGADSLGITLHRSCLNLFSVHALEMMRWNSKINLTAITDPLDVAVKHYIDSIAPADLIPQNAHLLDIGSGAGFPGIPLKIMYPSLTATLADAVLKKVSFLNHVGRALKLSDYRALHVRIDKGKGIRKFPSTRRKNVTVSRLNDSLAADVLEGKFDVVVARALASLENFLSMAVPMMTRKGRIVALKGRLTEAEIDSAMRTVDLLITNQELKIGSPTLIVRRYTLPFLGDKRSVFAVRFD